jgi:hypothetical protein
MSRYLIKVNTAGSWANLVSCPPDRLDAVQDACARLAAIIDHGIAFKVIDAASDKVIAQFNARPRANEPHGWYAPYQPADH